MGELEFNDPEMKEISEGFNEAAKLKDLPDESQGPRPPAPRSLPKLEPD